MAKLTRRKIINNRKSFNLFYKFIIFSLLVVFCLLFVFILNLGKTEFKRIEIYNKQVWQISNTSSKKNDLRLIVEKRTTVSVNLTQKKVDIIDFEGFDNRNGGGNSIIPNIVHLVFYRAKQLTFYETINIFSIYLNHNPNYIYIHCDINCSFEGIYWNKINSIGNLKHKIKLISYSDKDTIFGQKTKNKIQLLDAIRLLILMNYGGIILDSSVYVVNSLNKYRNFEMVASLEITPNERDRLSTQVLMAHKNARFLKAWYDSYRTRFSEILFYSSGTVAGRIFKSNPELVHVVGRNLGTSNIGYELYKTYWTEWKSFDTLSLYLNQNYQNTLISFVNAFQEDFLSNKTYNCSFTYCDMCNLILEKIKRES